MLASLLTAPVQAELQDTAKRRWTDALCIGWLNDGQRAVVLARPDAFAATASVLLVAGTKQALPTGGLRLLDAVRNMGTDGNTAGDAITFADRESADLYKAGWHRARAVSAVDEVFYDWKRNPLVYYVAAPIAASPACYIEIAYSKAPPGVAAITDPIDLADIYAPAVQEWMLYRALSINSAAGSMQRAQGHLQAFASLLGVKLQGEQRQRPQPDVEPAA